MAVIFANYLNQNGISYDWAMVYNKDRGQGAWVWVKLWPSSTILVGFRQNHNWDDHRLSILVIAVPSMHWLISFVGLLLIVTNQRSLLWLWSGLCLLFLNPNSRCSGSLRWGKTRRVTNRFKTRLTSSTGALIIVNSLYFYIYYDFCFIWNIVELL